MIALSKGFDGVKLLKRHRMITGESGALGSIMDTIHALELKTWTKAQYETKIAENKYCLKNMKRDNTKTIEIIAREWDSHVLQRILFEIIIKE